MVVVVSCWGGGGGGGRMWYCGGEVLMGWHLWWFWCSHVVLLWCVVVGRHDFDGYVLVCSGVLWWFGVVLLLLLKVAAGWFGDQRHKIGWI
jgi:hypothetical protein